MDYTKQTSHRKVQISRVHSSSAIGPGRVDGLHGIRRRRPDANVRHDCINPYASRSRLFLIVSALGRWPGRSHTSSSWRKCSVGDGAQSDSSWRKKKGPLCGNPRHEQKRACGHGEPDQRADFPSTSFVKEQANSSSAGSIRENSLSGFAKSAI